MQELTTLLSSRSAASLGTSKATSQAVLDTQSECSRGSSLLPLDCDLELCPPAGGSRVLRGGETGEYLQAFLREGPPHWGGTSCGDTLVGKRQSPHTPGCELQKARQLQARLCPRRAAPREHRRPQGGEASADCLFCPHRRSAHSGDNPGRPAVFSTWNQKFRKVE